MNRKLIILICIEVFALSSFAQIMTDTVSLKNNENAIQSLLKVLPGNPAIPSSEIVILMDQAGSTEMLEAAYVLVNCLFFNLSPSAMDESHTQEEMIPAIGILKRHFGESVCPIICYQAINTENEWMRERAALAIRAIATPQTIDYLKLTFSMSTSSNSNVKEFEKLLDAPNLIIKLYDPDLENAEKVMKAIEKNEEKK